MIRIHYLIALLLVLSTTQLHAQTNLKRATGLSATVITCPEDIQDTDFGPLSLPTIRSLPMLKGYEPKPTPGWRLDKTHKYSNVDFKVVKHQMSGNKKEMRCEYGVGSGSSTFRFYTLAKKVPGNKSCKAVGNFKFQCKLKNIRPK